MKNISNNTIVVAVGALIVGLIIGWFIGNAGAQNNSKVSTTKDAMETDSAMTDSSMMEDEDNNDDSDSAMMMKGEESDSAILVVDQEAGSTVTVASVETDNPVWVVVREDKAGAMGNILGASRIDAGASNNIVINLLRPTVADQKYYVVLLKDNGDRQFDHKVDMPLTFNGSVISKTFMAN